MLPFDISTSNALKHLTAPDVGGVSRRRFLQAIAAGAGATAAASLLPGGVAEALSPIGERDGILLIVMLGGGNDGLNTVVPYGNGAYYSKRPQIAIPQNQVLVINSDVGLSPSLTFVKERYDAGQVALVQGVGTASPDFSHFTSMANWMTGWGGTSPQLGNGWLGRWLDSLTSPDLLRAIHIGYGGIPLHLVGAGTRAVSLDPYPGGLGSGQQAYNQNFYSAIREFKTTSNSSSIWTSPLASALSDQLDVAATTAPVYPASFDGDRTAREFMIAARLINANIGTRVVSVSIGGFDHHDSQNGNDGQLELLKKLDDGLRLFWATLDPQWQPRTAAMTFSEFGRRVKGNSSEGSDHGAASCLMLMGPQVRGGLHATYPSLTTLLPHDQLAASVDYRQVYTSVIDRWLGGDSQALLGKNYEPLSLFARTPGDVVPGVPPIVSTSPATIIALSPTRVLDTRHGVGAPAHAVGPGTTIEVALRGVAGVPPLASAVLMNVTVTQPTSAGYVTVWPTGIAMPTASNLNAMPGQTVPNLVIAKLGASGKASFFNSSGSSHLIADVVGYLTSEAGGRLTTISPARLLDSRVGLPGAIGPGGSMELAVLGVGGVPAAGVTSVVLNVTVTEPTSAAYLTVWPAGEPRPEASSLNYVARQTVPNLVMAKVGAGGKIALFNSAGRTNVIVDVVGWIGPLGQSGVVPVAPLRLLDTRATNAPLIGGRAVDLRISGLGGVPSTGATAAVLNVTVTQPSRAGYLTVWPAGEVRPTTSNLNFVEGQTVPNLVVSKLGAGKVSMFLDAGSGHVLVDLVGYCA